MKKPNSHQSYSHIQIGKKANFFGRSYTVVGRIRYQAQIEEQEFGSSVVEKYSTTYDEWVLKGSTKEDLYITEEDGKFYLGLAWPVPAGTVLPKKPEKFLRVLEKHSGAQKITERGNLEVIFVEGETGGIEVGFENEYACYEYQKEYFGIEWEHIDPGEQQDVFYFHERVLRKQDIFEAFSLTELLGKEKTKQRKAKEYKWWSRFFLVVAVVVGVLYFVALFSTKELYRKDFGYDPQGTATQTQRFGPIALQKVGRVYNVQVVATRFSSYVHSIEAEVELLNNNKERVNFMAAQLWKYDEEIFQNPQEKNNYFRLSEPGNYFVQVTMKPTNQWESGLRVVVEENVQLGRYYLFSFVLSLILAFGFSRAAWYSKR